MQGCDLGSSVDDPRQCYAIDRDRGTSTTERICQQGHGGTTGRGGPGTATNAFAMRGHLVLAVTRNFDRILHALTRRAPPTRIL